MDSAVRIGLLYETYGFTLTQTQQALCEAHYYDDLSLSEIAENRAVSKQAVSTQLQRAVDKMELMEEHLHLLEQAENVRDAAAQLKEVLQSLPEPTKSRANELLQRLAAGIWTGREQEEGGEDV